MIGKRTGIDEVLLARPVSLDCQRDIAGNGEDHNDTYPYLPTLHIPLVEEAVIQPNGNVIRQRHDPGCSDCIVRPDIRDDVDLTPNWHPRDQEPSKQRSDWTFRQPVLDWMKHEFVAPISVFLPSRKLVVNRERHSFFEPITGPSCHPYDIAPDLESERHVEIFGYVRLAPVFLNAIFLKRDFLDRTPAQNRIVADERRHIAGRNTETDSGVNQVREEGNPVLEVIVRYLHYTAAELDDRHSWGKLHLRRCIEETVFGNTGIGVNNENVVTDPNVPVSPRTTVFRENSFEASFVSVSFIYLCPVGRTIDQLQCLFDFIRDPHTVVHVGSFLELSFALETIDVVSWTSGPADVMVGVELGACLAVLSGDKLQAVVVDEDVCCAALQLVGGDGLFDRPDCGCDHGVKSFFVDGALNGDVWEIVGREPGRRDSGEVF